MSKSSLLKSSLEDVYFNATDKVLNISSITRSLISQSNTALVNKTLSALNNSNIDSFYSDASKIKEPITIKVNNAKLLNGDNILGIDSITINTADRLTINTKNSGIFNVSLPVNTGSLETDTGKESALFVKNLLENTKSIQINPIIYQPGDNRKLVADINLDGASTSLMLAGTGYGSPASSSIYITDNQRAKSPSDIIPLSESLVNAYRDSTKVPLSVAERRVSNELLRNQNTQIKRPEDIKALHPGTTFNSRVNSFENSAFYSSLDNLKETYTFKIGDVILKIPPTHLSITQLRTTTDVDMIGFHSLSSSNPTTRIAFKINAIFTGNEIDTDLKRLLTQFVYCPFNIIHSLDLYNIIIAEDSSLKRAVKSDQFPSVPVTMDDYTVYTLEGHPDSVGCTMQFSLFNFMPYFDGDNSESLRYTKVNFDKDGNVRIDSIVQSTQHLEKAIHPYNFDIENIMKDMQNKWFLRDETIENIKFHNDDTASNVYLHKLTSFQDINFENIQSVIPDSRVDLIANGLSVRYENIFAWFPIGGYQHATPQYIGPGPTVLTLNAKVSFDENKTLSRLLSTYHETRSNDLKMFYDDRYMINTAMTRLCDCAYVSISDVAITSLPQHPGFSDVNIIFKKVPYVNLSLSSNKVAELDQYWGFQRIIRAVESDPVLLEEVNAQIELENNATKETFGWVGKWAINSGSTGWLNAGKDRYSIISDLLNIGIDIVYNSKISDKEKIIIENSELVQADGILPNIEELLNAVELFNSKKDTTILSTKDSISSVITNKNLIIDAIDPNGNKYSGNRTDARNLVLLLINKYKSIIGQSNKTIESYSYLLQYSKKLTVDSNNGWDDKQFKESLSKCLNNLQPTYDFTRKSTNTIRDTIDNAKVQLHFKCKVGKVLDFSIQPEDIKSIYDKIINQSLGKKVNNLGITAGPVSESTSYVQYAAILVDAAADAKEIQVKLSIAKTKKDSSDFAKRVNSNVAMPMPNAAHRYYPSCESFVKLDPRFSTTIGSYYYCNIANSQTYVTNMFMKFYNSLKQSISPMFDTKAWEKMFPSGHPSQQMYKKAIRENNPLWLLQAITFPTARKEVNEDVITANSNQKGGFEFGGTPMMNSVSSSINVDQSSLAADRPFSGLTDYIFLKNLDGDNVYGSPAMDAAKKQMTSRKKITFSKLVQAPIGATDTKSYPTEDVHSSFFRYQNLGMIGVTSPDGKSLKLKTDSTPAFTNGIGDDQGFSAPLDKEYHYNHIVNYTMQYFQANKKPDSIVSDKTNIVETPSSPIEENTQTITTEKAIKNFKQRYISALNRAGMVKYNADYSKIVDYTIGYISSDSKLKLQAMLLNNISDEDIEVLLASFISNVYSRVFGMPHSSSFIKKYSTSGSLYKFKTIYLKDCIIGKPSYLNGSKEPSDLLQSIFDMLLLLFNTFVVNNVLSNDSITFKTREENIIKLYSIATANIAIGYGVNTDILDTAGGLYPANLLNKSEKIFYYMPMPLFFAEGQYSTIFKEKIIDNFTGSNKGFSTSPAKISDAATRLYKSISDTLTVSSLEESISNGIDENLDKESEIDSNTSTYLMSQVVNGLMPTFGMQNAFPTYKMYIINPNMSDMRFHNLDDWYDFRLARDMMIIKSKDDPAHLLRARVVIDERFITIAMPIAEQDRMSPNEKRIGLPDSSTAGTSMTSQFYGGKIPLRTGMRIAIKLGYHTDPRYLDTVFIGTITTLQPTMDRYVFDLEAFGDGRELSAPASVTSEAITGLNWTEVIAKMLRASPAVFHFGKNYGTTIERFTREHHILYGIARSAKNGILSTQPTILNMLFTGSSAVSGIALARMAGIGLGLWSGGAIAGASAASAATMIALYNTYKFMGEENLTAQAREEVKSSLDKGLYSHSANKSLFNAKVVLHGQVYDSQKQIGQIFKHQYDTYKYGNDPIDDNIFAVDIWRNFTDVNAGTEPFKFATNKMSIWGAMTAIKRLYPNYALDVRPYGGRSTIYLGPLNWLMWRTDDPVLASSTQLYETSNENFIKDVGEHFRKMANRNELMEMTTNSLMPPQVEFQRTHLATSDSNIIFNGIKSTPERAWNHVIVNTEKGSYDVMANAELHPGVIRTRVEDLQFTTNRDVSQQYALGLLKEGVEKMYGGTLALRGNPKIEPYDKIYICDHLNKMYGWVEVETVIHKFDTNFGYTTHITPNMVCSVNSDAYKTTSQLVRSLMTNDQMVKAIGSFLGGSAAGWAIGGGLTLAGITISAPVALALSVIAGGSLLVTAYGNINDALREINEKIDSASAARRQEVEVYEAMASSYRGTMYAGAYTSGMYYGFVAKNLHSLYNMEWKTIKNTSKNITMGGWETFRNIIEKGWKSNMLPNSIGAGRVAAQANGLMNSISKSLSAVVNTIQPSTGKISTTADLNAAINELDDMKTKISASNVNITDKMRAKYIERIEAAKTTLQKTMNDAIADATKKATAAGKAVPGLVKLPQAGNIPTRSLKAGIGRVAPTIGRAMGLSTATLLVDAIAALPQAVETISVYYATKGNCISISPLYSKNQLMITGLDGFQYTNSFIHLKNIVVNAKRVLGNLDDAINWRIPTLANNPFITPDVQKKVDDLVKSRKATPGKTANITGRMNNVTKWKNEVNSAIEKNKKLIAKDCAKDILSESLIYSIIDNESGGSQYAIGNGNIKNGVTWNTGRGIMQLTAANQWENFWNSATDEQKSMMQNVGLSLNTQIGGERSDTRKNIQSFMTEWPETNIAAGTRFITGLINEACKIYDCNTADGKSKILEYAVKSYLSGSSWRTNASLPNYKNKASVEAERYYSNILSKMSLYKSEIQKKADSYNATLQNNTLKYTIPTAESVLSGANGAAELEMIKSGTYAGVKYFTGSSNANGDLSKFITSKDLISVNGKQFIVTAINKDSYSVINKSNKVFKIPFTDKIEYVVKF